MYQYVIYGGGPTGMTLAYLLSKNNKKVLLVEKEDKLGGCWKVEWFKNKYFTEHSPRVLLQDTNSSLFKLFNKISFNWKEETVSTYGNL
ncbi:MAG: NAD(P)-binding protein, partial [Bacteroidota bacterium]